VKGVLLALLLPLAAHAADPEKGRALVLGRMDGNCLLCHAIPGADRPAGNIGPSLAGIANRFSSKELKERVIDASRFNAKTVMPPYGRTEGLHEVASQYRGKPVLAPAEIDDVVAFLLTLR
jgi:L-cysteine S-thiosulfotransferase